MAGSAPMRRSTGSTACSGTVRACFSRSPRWPFRETRRRNAPPTSSRRRSNVRSPRTGTTATGWRSGQPAGTRRRTPTCTPRGRRTGRPRVPSANSSPRSIRSRAAFTGAPGARRSSSQLGRAQRAGDQARVDVARPRPRVCAVGEHLVRRRAVPVREVRRRPAAQPAAERVIRLVLPARRVADVDEDDVGDPSQRLAQLDEVAVPEWAVVPDLDHDRLRQLVVMPEPVELLDRVLDLATDSGVDADSVPERHLELAGAAEHDRITQGEDPAARQGGVLLRGYGVAPALGDMVLR